ncbi:DUF397 domain-containing protein [Streptomyces sp. AM2-3-1]|nr:DUF397 domain-containing protein [Streptomyces sp. AM2-3-1]WNO69791.1 DUF397 domain-containing protein [Streptomyces sp. AM2-3-1]
MAAARSASRSLTIQSTVCVRDSKQPRRPHIAVSHHAWARFVASLRTQ